MNKSESITKIAAALTKAQKNIGAARKNEENPFFKSSYATLSEVMSVCKEPLLAQGISVLQLVGYEGGDNYVETILLHESGEFLSDRMKVLCMKPDMQTLGSGISYARRYGLQAACFIPAVDDDGELVTEPYREKARANEAVESRQAARERTASRAGREEVSQDSGPNNRTRSRTDRPVQDWTDVICTYGKKDGPIRGKKLGELEDRTLAFLYAKFVESGQEVDEKDKPLADALKVWKLIDGQFPVGKTPETPTVEQLKAQDEIPF